MSAEIASTYDEVYRGKGANRKELRIDRWPRNRKEGVVYFAPGGKRVLDVGCGSGIVLYNLRDRYESLHGVELSAERVETSNKTLDGLNAQVAVGNVEDGLPYEDGYFDTIVTSDVIEHVFNVWPATQEMARLVRPGGQVILTTPNIAEIRRRFILLAGRFPSTSADDEGFGVRTENELLDGGHVHYFTFRMLEKLFKRYGFSKVERRGIGRLGRFHDLSPPLLSACCLIIATR